MRTILLYLDDVLEQEAHLRARKNDFKLGWCFLAYSSNHMW